MLAVPQRHGKLASALARRDRDGRYHAFSIRRKLFRGASRLRQQLLSTLCLSIDSTHATKAFRMGDLVGVFLMRQPEDVNTPSGVSKSLVSWLRWRLVLVSSRQAGAARSYVWDASSTARKGVKCTAIAASERVTWGSLAEAC